MTYEEIISTTASLAGDIAKLMCQLNISDEEEEYYLNIALRNLQKFAKVYRYKYKKVFKED